MKKLAFGCRLLLAGVCGLFSLNAWGRVDSPEVRRVFEMGFKSIVEVSSTNFTPGEKKQLLDEVWQDIQGSPHLYTEEEARLFVKSMKEEISRNGLSGESPGSTIRGLSLQKQILFVRSHVFFFDALSQKKLAIPSPDDVVRPFADILKQVANEYLVQVDEGSRKAMIQEFVESRTGISENALVPSGKRKPSQEELRSFREELQRKAEESAKRTKQDHLVAGTPENWKSSPALRVFYATAMRLWSRYTWIKDVVDINDPRIRERMETDAKTMKEIDEKIAEEQKKQDVVLKKDLDERLAQAKMEEIAAPLKGDVGRIEQQMVDSTALTQRKDDTLSAANPVPAPSTAAPIIPSQRPEHEHYQTRLLLYIALSMGILLVALIVFVSKRHGRAVK